ncbi:hypothetical protein AGR13a_Cc160027 [Agrobacterium genomosp. 13 str. CFBP 6927]|uniref:Transposase n=1 Tax=Agrobacterium genomosp. 13 str. CFBP 6927 TaxID=1183428 RepID=A0ABM9VAT8_9HYPH|nr:hypothetical protein AGR13a_Cc160027 [Agrobacterium genomosp. 13 str. CFBP 6927]
MASWGMAVNDIVATLYGRLTSVLKSWITSSVVPSNPQAGGNEVPAFPGNVIRCHEFTAWQTRHERNLKIVRLTNK